MPPAKKTTTTWQSVLVFSVWKLRKLTWIVAGQAVTKTVLSTGLGFRTKPCNPDNQDNLDNLETPSQWSQSSAVLSVTIFCLLSNCCIKSDMRICGIYSKNIFPCSCVPREKDICYFLRPPKKIKYQNQKMENLPSPLLPKKPKQTEFVVVCAFADEAHILPEFIDHYLREGASCIYLIDNASSDTSADRIKRHPKQEKIRYMFEPDKKMNQSEMINRHFAAHKNAASWVLVVDTDDFVYSRRSETTIQTFLTEFCLEHGDATQILLPVKIFGSSEFIRQPDDIVQSFLRRQDYAPVHAVKSLVFAPRVLSFGINVHSVWKGTSYLSDGSKVSQPKDAIAVTRELQQSDKTALALNRYSTQSLEVFMNCKSVKAGKDPQTGEFRLTMTILRNIDAACSITDTELSRKIYSRLDEV